ncbi:hypothetical protein JEQ21_03540 [Streptococcus sp. 121]|uniref:hypothetical protein n=1 Tax=Streptococcus sp. 121 TaxID=2797637 RepID=UPI0018F0D4F0|nr:hypothetical protein [Streptococcus sp. 121]MBJ6745546.1 hypothetical protein [Streptococcus sp. 121]
MENFQFWLTLTTATIPAAITGLLSFCASWLKNQSDIKSLREQFKHDMETLEKSHKNELEKMKEAHKLELENIQKQSELDMTKEMFGMVMNAAAPALQEAISDEVKKQRNP